MNNFIALENAPNPPNPSTYFKGRLSQAVFEWEHSTQELRFIYVRLTPHQIITYGNFKHENFHTFCKSVEIKLPRGELEQCCSDALAGKLRENGWAVIVPSTEKDKKKCAPLEPLPSQALKK